MNIEDYKKTSFLANVTNEEIRDFLNLCGYRLDYRIVDEADGQRKTIERIYDSRNRKVKIEVCAINIDQEKIYITIARKSGLYSVFDNRFSTTLIFITDYKISVLGINDDTKIQNIYAKFMYKKFGERYKKSYNRVATMHNKKISNDNLQK